VFKEGTLGFFNGLMVGATAGIGMVVYATMTGAPQPWLLGMIVSFSMIIACTVASIAGALIPLALKKLGADPATASSIFLTTASDVASMGIFLSMATALML
jgi:magnesium transporter